MIPLVDRTGNTMMPCQFNRYRSCCLWLQFHFSYVLGVFSSSIIAISMIQFFRTFNQQWLILIGAGVIFIIIGAMIYCNGVLRLDEHDLCWSMTNKRDRSKRYKRTARESHIFESYLSINMLPQCFNSLDITSSSSAANILHQQRLMLPRIDTQQIRNDSNRETMVDIHLPQQQSMSPSIATTNNESNNDSGLMEQQGDDTLSNDRIYLISQQQTMVSGSDSEDSNCIESPPSYDDVVMTDSGIYRTI